MPRVLVGSATAIYHQFLGVDETPAPAAAPSVAVEGLVAGGMDDLVAEPVEGEIGLYRAVLPPTHTGQLDHLVVTWAGEVDGYDQTHRQDVDVVDGHYATIPELRAHPDLADETRVPTVALLAARDGFAELVERARGATWVGRVARVEVRGSAKAGRVSTAGIFLDTPHVRDVVAADVDGAPVDITGWTVDGGLLHLPAAETSYAGSAFSFTYLYGLTDPIPQCLNDGCREYVRTAVLAPESGIPRNALSWSDGAGGTYRTSTADWAAGRFTGIMSVDDKINEAPDYRGYGMP